MNIGKKDIIWSYIAQILHFGSGLLLLPFILKLFSTHEIALWYMFLNMTAIAYIMDFGFMPNITRTISYIYSGAIGLSKEGLPEKSQDSGINYDLLKSVIKVVQKIYGIITVILLVILFIGGGIYLKSIISYDDPTLWAAFYIYSFSLCLNFFYSYYDALLLGRGLVKAANQAISISKFTYLLLSVIGITLGFGLISIAFAHLISTFTNRFLFYGRFYDKDTKQILKIAKAEKSKEIFHIIWHNAQKLGVTSVCAFLMFQSNLLIAGKYFTLAEVASFGLVLQLYNALANFSRLYFTTLIPKFNNLRINGQKVELKYEFIRSMKIAWLFFIVGALIICLGGNVILSILHSKASLPTGMITFLFGLIYFFEVTQGNSAAFITTSNTVPFVNAAVLSAVGVIFLNFLLILVFHLRIEAFGISILVVQLSYNTWKWPYIVFKELNMQFNDFFKTVL